MTEQKFKIYSSSAGSGKTYTLTKEYLKLALQTDNPHYFKNILAITFTNDAANEMKVRIVNSLKGFAFPESLSEKEKNRSEDFLQVIANELNLDKEKVRTRATKTFAKILYNYADFSVSTIDKFVNKVTGAFTRELEIPYNYEVDLDTDQMLQNAVDRVLEKVGRENKERLSEFVIDWVNQKAEEGKNWGRVGTELADFASQLMNESAYPFINQLKVLSIEDYKVLNQFLKNDLENIELKINKLARQGYSLILSSHIPIKDFHYGEKGIPGYFKNHFEKFKETFLKSYPNYAKDAIEKDKWYGAKSASATMIDAIKDELRNIIEEIEEFKQTNQSRYLIKDAILPHLYKLALIQEIEGELAEVKRENNSIHISDTNKKIAEIIAHEPVPYIYERVGEKYHHILIDEFQDTSVLQWQNLLPLVENGLSEGFFNLIVGDAKQAIYRWRGGEMEQLVYLYKKEIENLVGFNPDSEYLAERYETIARNTLPVQLSYNFRSTQEVIDFNNDFFRTLVETDFGKKYPLLEKVYETFEQKVPDKPKTGGQVEIEFLEKSDIYREETHQKVLDLIQKLQAEGWKLGDIAVLTRSNQPGRDLANYLKEQGIEVVSQDSLTLISDEKVRFLAAFLKVIHRPEDKLAKSEALYLFYKVVKNEIPNPQTNQEIQQILNKSIIAFYEKLNQEGYPVNYTKLNSLNLYEIVEKLINIFKLMQSQAKLEFVFRFLDVILQFNLQKQSSLGDFLEYWEEKKGSLSINATPNPNAVTVTSIHKSKGLEYPIVILPFADWSFTPRNTSTMWVDISTEQLNFISASPPFVGMEKILPVGLVNMNKNLEHTSIGDQYLAEMEKIFIENVNMLYVAFTRPVYRLYIFSKMADFTKDGGQKNINYLIYLYLLYKNEWEESQSVYPLKDSGNQVHSEAKAGDEDIFYIEDFVSTEFNKKIKRKGKKAKKD
ncbi:MAG: UvrD-helicase domain-containing protein [Microscillaceae bacterium]|jgi:ATP-dependent exoDNAse (exonuclease V) beta subunit|nr:UvrD-helicase domain-containing protein [Microscillaceae bacterium]